MVLFTCIQRISVMMLVFQFQVTDRAENMRELSLSHTIALKFSQLFNNWIAISLKIACDTEASNGECLG